MLGYICKYTPVEIFEAMDTEIVRIEPSAVSFTQADALMHSNICSFAKGVLETFGETDYEGLVFTTCCDSMRRLYDVLKRRFPEKFFYMLDLPRKVNEFAASLYEKQIRDMAKAYADFSGKTFHEEKLLEICRRKAESSRLRQAPAKEPSLRIGLAGARPGRELKNMLEDLNVEILFDLTCTGLARNFSPDSTQPLGSYSYALLNQIPCMRMMKASNRIKFIDGFRDRLDGIIYHTIKFCDIYSYEYEYLKNEKDIPIVLVETDTTPQCQGQIRTRIEAFIESLKISRGIARQKPDTGTSRQEDRPMYVLGIDSGSTSTNAVILDNNKKILASSVIRTGAKSTDSAQRALELTLEQAGLKREDLSRIISTGYGRVSIPFAQRNVTEISCHARGAHFLNPDVRTILDIGGQDSKAIRINDKGEVTDFVMNDKCAAGTGRFLEMMARTLEISTEELGPVSLQWKENIDISSMCSVFAESEVISLIAQNKEKADIIHGLHKAIAGKAVSLLKRVSPESRYMMTGGVAKNAGVVAVLEEKLGEKLFIYQELEIIGALGAALYGLEDMKN